MFFEDIDKQTLPASGQYYFNVLIACISMPEDFYVEGYSNYLDVWDLSAINEPIPFTLHIFQDTEFKKERYNHCVVEVSDLGVAWYKTRATEKL